MDILNEALLLYNLPFTIGLGLTLLYWLGILLGFLDLEMFDYDVEVEVDTEIDIETDIDAHGPGILTSFLQFLNIGEVPFMLIFNITTILAWLFAMCSNHYFNPMNSLLIAAGLAIPNFVFSIIGTKYLSWPLKKIFKAMDGGKNFEEITGKLAKVISPQISNKMGQIEIQTDGAPYLINAIAEEGKVFNKGDEVIIFDVQTDKFDENKKLYIISKSNI